MIGWNVMLLNHYIKNQNSPYGWIDLEGNFYGCDYHEHAFCLEVCFGNYENKIKPVKNQILPLERTMVLRLMDRAWQNQIDVMSKLREGIHLRSYAQNNPLQAYVEEGYELFENMMNTISSDVVTFCNNLKIVIKEK